ncbi:MAG TPA: gamma-glutamyltransferase [Methylophilaceae bacterium]|jgi:gamma-glutamyltranspeptidase/glutathione hydrolase|nr:gamma-glutamyltransferase [Methylophilaceae bacterium]
MFHSSAFALTKEFPMSERSQRTETASRPSWRPTVIGTHYAVACGHYLAAAAAARILERGGNAVDAGVTAAMALAVLQPDIVCFAGVAPTLVYLAESGQIVSLAGLGYWPAATDVARLASEGNGTVPEGLLRTVVPAAPATHIEALQRFGTISFEEAATPAYQLARDGFAMYPVFARTLDKHAEKYDRYPDNARIFRPGGRTPEVGSLFQQADLACSIKTVIDAERHAVGDRIRKLQGAHDCFYRGPIAKSIADYHRANRGFFTEEDLATFEVPVETAISCHYKGIDLHSCDVWCQGIVLLETLKILEGVDLKALGHNSVSYVHVVAEALNLAFADREAYVGDPKFVSVPTTALLSDEYAARQRARIDKRRAFGAMPSPGLPAANHVPYTASFLAAGKAIDESHVDLDTIYCSVVDRHGNAYSATLSDNSRDTPIIPGTGLAISSRGCQSRLEPGHPSEVKPGKRPRLTPTPAMAFQNDEFLMAFGTPGGDVQTQAMLQVFLNVTEFGMTVQQAIEAPRFGTFSFPNSFAPHAYLPGRLNIESRFPETTVNALRQLGHDVELWPDTASAAGAVCMIRRDPDTHLLHAGADPRREAYALTW